MIRPLILGLVAVVALSACRKEATDTASIQKDLHKRGTLDLLKQTAEDRYDPPADGRLTDAQMAMYLKVREHEKEINAVARREAQEHVAAAKNAGEKSLAGMMEGLRAAGSVADMMTADIRAAKDLGFNTHEYLWIKGQVLAASTTAMAEKSSQALSAAADSTYSDLKKAYEAATDEDAKKVYAQMLAGMDQQRKDIAQNVPEVSAAIAYNRKLVEKYESVLKAFTEESSKYENATGEAKKAVEDFTQKTDELIAKTKTK